MEKFHEEMHITYNGQHHVAKINNWSGHGEQRTYRIESRKDLVLEFDFENEPDFPWAFGRIDERGRHCTCFPNGFETWHDAMRAMIDGDPLFWKQKMDILTAFYWLVVVFFLYSFYRLLKDLKWFQTNLETQIHLGLEFA